MQFYIFFLLQFVHVKYLIFMFTKLNKNYFLLLTCLNQAPAQLNAIFIL